MTSKYLNEERQQRLSRHEYDFDDSLAGRTVLVAGGSGGLGAAICARLMRDGAGIILGYASDGQRAEATAVALRARYGGEARVAEADICTDAGRERLVSAAEAAPDFYGVVVCVGDPARVRPEELGLATLESALRANYSGPILLARACAEILAERRVPGAVVLLSSMQGVAAFPGSLAYSGPKAALAHAGRILAQEYGGAANIRVNVVAPGVNEAGMALASIRGGKYDPFVADGVIPRFGRPEDVARCVGFLMAPDNYVTGQVLLVDGGLTLRRGVAGRTPAAESRKDTEG
jgi:3-oxoacyl-[acyl-carrier protein] reductase